MRIIIGADGSQLRSSSADGHCKHHPVPERPTATALPDGRWRPEPDLTWPTGLLAAAENTSS
jgi:hypothetical protein